MSIYKKMNDLRSEFHGMELKKSGWNAFSKYSYFELSDFLVPALALFKKHGLFYYISFTEELATMTIVDAQGAYQPGEAVEVPANTEMTISRNLDELLRNRPPESIVITSPMGSAKLKACHEVQNIGAVETYQRRYLLIAALEIVEHCAVNASEPVEPDTAPKQTKKADYTMAEFNANQDKMAGMIKSGERTPDSIIEKLNKNYRVEGRVVTMIKGLGK